MAYPRGASSASPSVNPPATSGEDARAGLVAVYLRESTREQLDGYGLDAQRRATSDERTRRGWVLYHEYVDAGFSGTSMRRRASLRQLLADAERGCFGTVLVHKLDRLARNLGDAVRILELLRAHGVSLVSLGEGLDMTSPFAPVIVAVLFALAESYSRNLGTEVRKGQREVHEAGRWIGAVPFGYVLAEPGTRGSHLALGPDVAYARFVYELAATGRYPATTIAHIVNTYRAEGRLPTAGEGDRYGRR